MNTPLTEIKLFFTTSSAFFLALSLLSSDFYDPTLFHQLHPMGSIQNWCGIFGALTGGTLVELFGPASLLIPWFVFKLPYTSKSRIHHISTGYYAFVTILTISIAQALWWPQHYTNSSNFSFLLHSGHVGILGGQWLQQIFHTFVVNTLVGAVLIFCIVKIFDELPIRILIYGIITISLFLPIYVARQIQILIRHGYQWANSTISALRGRSNQPIAFMPPKKFEEDSSPAPVVEKEP
ncbi:MAG: DNA translocase FtsK 4TM domain-containing protein [SAR324 cluster bacterium]|nr:DNA translocase FtsK 4TM domain-containing protein [SAR324 cluster bacterium]